MTDSLIPRIPGDPGHAETFSFPVVDAALTLQSQNLAAIVLVCTNLISSRADIQKALKVPVYDLVSLIEFYVSGLRLTSFHTAYI